MAKPSNQEIQNFLDSLKDSSKEKEIVQYFLTTIAAQADTINTLNNYARMIQGYEALIDDAISGLILTSIASILSNPSQTGFTYEEAMEDIKKMREELKNANEAQQMFTSIAQFAIKFAPLILT